MAEVIEGARLPVCVLGDRRRGAGALAPGPQPRRTSRSPATTSRSCPTPTRASACRSAACCSPTGAVVPYAIGVDIGCGVQLARTNLVWEDDFGAGEATQRPAPDPARRPDRASPSHSRPRSSPRPAARARWASTLPGVGRTARWFDRAAEPARHARRRQPLPRGPARRGQPRSSSCSTRGSRNLGKTDLRRRSPSARSQRATPARRELPDPELAYLPLDADEDAEPTGTR